MSLVVRQTFLPMPTVARYLMISALHKPSKTLVVLLTGHRCLCAKQAQQQGPHSTSASPAVVDKVGFFCVAFLFPGIPVSYFVVDFVLVVRLKPCCQMLERCSLVFMRIKHTDCLGSRAAGPH